MAKLFAYSGYPDQTPHSAASDLGLHCLPITLLGVSRLQLCLPGSSGYGGIGGPSGKKNYYIFSFEKKIATHTHAHTQTYTRTGTVVQLAQLDAPSDWRPGGRGFNPRQGR